MRSSSGFIAGVLAGDARVPQPRWRAAAWARYAGAMDEQEIKRSMAPAGAIDPLLLILGSLPGEASLAAQRYYAHPQNQFWRLLSGAIGEDLATIGHDERIERLAARGIALWDVVGEARRSGSLDGAIRAARANPLRDFVDRHDRLRGIAFNGATAARLGRKALGELAGLMLIDLPSSSPAYTLAFDAKAERWAVLGPLAGLAPPTKGGTVGR